MNRKSYKPIVVKIIVGCLILTGIILAFSNTISKEKTTEEKPLLIDVPHTFTPPATGLMSSEKVSSTHIDPRLNKYDIRRSLIPALQCRDLELEQEVVLTLGEMMIPLTAYDSKKKIGYVWLDYPLFGEGLIDESLTKYKSQKQAEQKFLSRIEDGIELFMDNEEKFLLDIFGEDPNEIKEEEEEIVDESPENIWADFANISPKERETFMKFARDQNMRAPRFSINRSINATRNNWSFFREAYDDLELMYNFGQEIQSGLSKLHKYEDRREYLELTFSGFKKKIFLNQMNQKPYKTTIDEWIFSAAEMLEDPIRFFGFVERIKYIGYPTIPNALSRAIDEEVFKINTTTDSKKWREHSEALIKIMQANKIPVINSKPEYEEVLAQIITTYPYKKWSDHYDAINEISNKYTISKKELEALPGLSVSHGISIAPISILDDRMIYDMQEKEYMSKLSDIRKKIKNSKDKSERKSLQEELLNHSSYRSKNYARIRDNAKAKSMNVILEEVEVFLDWALEIAENWQIENPEQS